MKSLENISIYDLAAYYTILPRDISFKLLLN